MNKLLKFGKWNKISENLILFISLSLLIIEDIKKIRDRFDFVFYIFILCFFTIYVYMFHVCYDSKIVLHIEISQKMLANEISPN